MSTSELAAEIDSLTEQVDGMEKLRKRRQACADALADKLSNFTTPSRKSGNGGGKRTRSSSPWTGKSESERQKDTRKALEALNDPTTAEVADRVGVSQATVKKVL